MSACFKYAVMVQQRLLLSCTAEEGHAVEKGTSDELQVRRGGWRSQPDDGGEVDNNLRARPMLPFYYTGEQIVESYASDARSNRHGRAAFNFERLVGKICVGRKNPIVPLCVGVSMPTRNSDRNKPSN
mmetsp:Transcript_16356/g.24219  ORF Transcript_16356/g.24219 Transcript_16356/m.24219 type:complete len:128 (-) Transcript_16356:305-688(-)|eukprot:CAMPEP_0194039766 /NCGR_PEP_ID=MMETSP0009_2-20130614/11872_1 /TAXON_ID=210454 /ORGANISM="Grammatophora oceanica, Strain CCMP 410" /LENGTH=127 /DNA_ID=CAMNT_0038682711 /DNA_START=317 /DNA_END=700 /DNA_ORIENTATION=-